MKNRRWIRIAAVFLFGCLSVRQAPGQLEAPADYEPIDAEADLELKYSTLVLENQYLHRRIEELEMRSHSDASETGEVQRLVLENNALRAQIEAFLDAEEADGPDAQTENEELKVFVEDLSRKLQELDQKAKRLEDEKSVLEVENRRLKRAGNIVNNSSPLQSDAEDSFTMMKAALAQENHGNYSAALALYERAADLLPGYLAPERGKARCLLNQQRPADAKRLLKNLLQDNPDDVEAMLLLGAANNMAGEYAEALKVLDRVIAKNPDNPSALSARGAASMGMGNLSEARRDLEKSVSIDPALRDAHFNLAQILARMNAGDLARSHYDKAVELGAARDDGLEAALENRTERL